RGRPGGPLRRRRVRGAAAGRAADRGRGRAEPGRAGGGRAARGRLVRGDALGRGGRAAPGGDRGLGAGPGGCRDVQGQAERRELGGGGGRLTVGRTHDGGRYGQYLGRAPRTGHPAHIGDRS